MRTRTVWTLLILGALVWGQGRASYAGEATESKAQHGPLPTTVLRAAVRRKGGLLPFRDQAGEPKRCRLGGLDRTTPPGIHGSHGSESVLLVQRADDCSADGAHGRVRRARYGRETEAVARGRDLNATSGTRNNTRNPSRKPQPRGTTGTCWIATG